MPFHIASPDNFSKGDAKGPTSESSCRPTLPSPHDGHSAVVEILTDFLREMGPFQSDTPITNEAIEALMRREMNKRNIACPELENILHASASLSEVRNFSPNSYMFGFGVPSPTYFRWDIINAHWQRRQLLLSSTGTTPFLAFKFLLTN